MTRRIEVDEALLIYAVRYTLGRRTYAVGDVCMEIASHAKTLEPGIRGVLRDEISEALGIAEGSGRTVGDKCDHRRWEQALKALDAAA
jgi:hypothetical protein